jgi:hypothetical protein
VVVVAPATAVAGAATTTRFRQGNIPGLLFRLTAGIRSRGEIIYAERAGSTYRHQRIPLWWVDIH